MKHSRSFFLTAACLLHYAGLCSTAAEQLTAYQTNNQIQLTWPAAPGVKLQYSSALATNPAWFHATNTVATSNGTAAVSVSPAQAQCFYRLALVRGADVPYLTYEAENGAYAGGAVLKGPSMVETNLEAEASGRQYVELNQSGEYIEWTVQQPARGLVMRFSIPDSPAGTGTVATVGLYVNGSRIASLPLTSRFAWQYFPYVSDSMDASNDPSTGRPFKRFDDVRYLFPSALNANDVVRIQKDAQDTSPSYAIDLIDLEPVPDAIAAPANSLNVTQSPYNAVPNDNNDDYAAFNSCVAAAKSAGKTMYIPPGRYLLNQQFKLSDVKVQGGGIWHTELHFSNPNACGILGQGSNVFAGDLYLTTETITRSGSHGIGGLFGQNSLLTNLWSEHFHTGVWIGDYTGANKVTDGLILSRCRFRNSFADGLNFARGTKNSVIENSNFRNNGDDAMASWASDTGSVAETSGNVFRFNTVENTYRAAGLGIFGGRGHLAHDCIIRDVVGGPGIRFNTVFPGYGFSTSSDMVVSNMTLLRTGSTDLWGIEFGAVTLETVNGPVRNIRFSGLDITNSKHHGIYYGTGNGNAITNVFFNTVNISSSGKYGIYVKNGATGWSENSFVTVTGSGIGALFDNAPFDPKKIQGNTGW